MDVTMNSSNNNGLSSIESLLKALEPIRDLAKNWDIDIASCLDEYLEDVFLDHDYLSQETRQRLVLNFTQAALVLQNSSGVYSRKVDYLHSYTYRVQQEIVGQTTTSNNNNNNKSNRQKTGIDAELERLWNHDPYQEFLLLDDVLPMDDNGSKINLIENDNQDGNNDPMTTSFLSTSFSKRLSLETGGGKTTIYNNSSDHTNLLLPGGGALQVAAQRAWMGMDHNNALRLVGNTCDIQDDGALCLPGTTMNNHHRHSHQTIEQQQHLESENPESSFVNMQDATEYEFAGNGGDAFDDGMDDDDHNEGTGYQMRERNDHSETKKRVTFAEETIIAENRKKFNIKDPWTMMDPHDIQKAKKTRPLRIGKTIVLPKGLDSLPSQYGSGKHKKRVIQRHQPLLQPPPSMAAQLWDIQRGKRRAEEISTVSLRKNNESHHNNEFAYIAVKMAQQREEQRRRLRKQRQEQELHQVAVEMESNDQPDIQIAIDDDEDNYGGGGYDFGGEDDHDIPLESNTGITLVDEIYPNRELDETNSFSDRPFEELCRAHIRAFQKGAEKYAVATQLSKRVDQWQSKLAPLLEEEERRPVFDIHAYGSAVIETMERTISQRHTGCDDDSKQQADLKSARSLDFREITQGCPSFEVCRMFLAALSLNNAGNVRFVHQNDTDGNHLQLELLHSNLELPMETFLAPSAQEST